MIRVLTALLGASGMLAAIAPASRAAPAIARDEDVPLYEPGDAWRLAHVPESRMIDATTCERVEGVFRTDATGQKQVVAGGRSALFRKDRPGTPFMRVEAREDGVYVARFPARPNEVIEARAFVVDPRTRRFIYGDPVHSVCREPKVQVGELTPGQ